MNELKIEYKPGDRVLLKENGKYLNTVQIVKSVRLNSQGTIQWLTLKGMIREVPDTIVAKLDEEPSAENRITFYSDRQWLNDHSSRNTGSIVCFDGMWKEDDGKVMNDMFIEVADCYGKIKIHKSQDQSIDEYIEKVRTMRNAIDSYLDHLETKWS